MVLVLSGMGLSESLALQGLCQMALGWAISILIIRYLFPLLLFLNKLIMDGIAWDRLKSLKS